MLLHLEHIRFYSERHRRSEVSIKMHGIGAYAHFSLSIPTMDGQKMNGMNSFLKIFSQNKGDDHDQCSWQQSNRQLIWTLWNSQNTLRKYSDSVSFQKINDDSRSLENIYFRSSNDLSRHSNFSTYGRKKIKSNEGHDSRRARQKVSWKTQKLRILWKVYDRDRSMETNAYRCRDVLKLHAERRHRKRIQSVAQAKKEIIIHHHFIWTIRHHKRSQTSETRSRNITRTENSDWILSRLFMKRQKCRFPSFLNSKIERDDSAWKTFSSCKAQSNL